MDFDVERVERLERRLRGWEVVVKVFVGVFFLVMMGRVGWGVVSVVPKAKKIFEDMLGPGARLPVLSEWVLSLSNHIGVAGLVVMVLAGVGIWCGVRLPRGEALWGVMVCGGALLLADLIVGWAIRLPVHQIFSQLSG